MDLNEAETKLTKTMAWSDLKQTELNQTEK